MCGGQKDTRKYKKIQQSAGLLYYPYEAISAKVLKGGEETTEC